MRIPEQLHITLPRRSSRSPAQTLIAAAVLAAVAASAPAQQPAPAQLQFAELRLRALPPDVGDTRAVASGDVDGDGDVDLVVARLGQNRLYLNDGSGVFTDATATNLPADSDTTTSVALGDIDGDGDLDLVCGNGDTYGQQNRVYRNDGRGVFVDATAVSLPPVADPTAAVVAGDVDGDGDLDLVVGNDYLLYQGGTYPKYYTFAVGQQNRLYLNDGSGVFSDATATNLPADSDFTSAAALGDVDGDGDLDLICGNGGYGTGQQNRLYLNNGSGSFTDVTATRMPGGSELTAAATLGDVDGDGDLDLVFGNGGQGTGQQDRLYVNDGSGGFVDVTMAQMPVDDHATRAVACADVDGDGDLDLVLGGGQQRRLYLNGGTGAFTEDTAARLPADHEVTSAVAFCDVDGDGHPDLFAGIAGWQDRLYINSGGGFFADASAGRLRSDGAFTHAVALGDVDGDGDQDLVLGNIRAQNRLFLNDGRGWFRDATATRMPLDSDETMAAALGDVDGDGDLDLVFGNSGFPGQQNRLYLNNGGGSFVDATAARLPLQSHGTQAVALGDVDGDGDLDLVCGNAFPTNLSQHDRIYRNDGSGVFTDVTATQMPTGSGWSPTFAVALGDIDGDGDLDLATGAIVGRQNRLYRNDGSGRFTEVTAAQLPFDSDDTQGLAFGDVDGDGDVDLIVGNRAPGQHNRLYVNDGSGTFTDQSSPRMPGVDGWASAVALADVDGDGDLDLVSAGTPSRIYLNLLRQLDSPWLLRSGRTHTLEVHARYGPPRLFDVALTYLALAPASIPVPPYGTVGIDPSSSVALPLLVVPQPAGVGSVSFTVPNDPRLVGLRVHGQALLVQYPAEARFTNVITEAVR